MKHHFSIIITLMIFIFIHTTVAAQADTGKPNITILATGGTIAGSSASKTDTTDYQAGSLGIQTLIDAVPELNHIAHITGEQIANVDSNDIDNHILLTLSKKVNQLLSQNQQGVVITHGTDTLEESAFFLSLTVKQSKPTVFVGAMRPATAISADGPMNLLEAVTLAASPQAQQRGTMVVLNDRIASAFYVTKTNAVSNDTFKAIEQGYLGLFINGQPKFFYTPAAPIDQVYFDVSQLTNLPRVDIIYVHQGQDATLLNAAISAGAKGIVIDATGNGNMPKALEEAVAKALTKNIPIVITSRTGAGYVSNKKQGISSGFLNAQKSRILLQLAIATGANLTQIETYFDHQR
ncbi:asparaginase [Utexia brackfieldae]|uniref:asparaginase n=1 Tax=Utexia brackfieldae TaxID=3074108 RepID=UPI00370D62E5